MDGLGVGPRLAPIDTIAGIRCSVGRDHRTKPTKPTSSYATTALHHPITSATAGRRPCCRPRFQFSFFPFRRNAFCEQKSFGRVFQTRKAIACFIFLGPHVIGAAMLLSHAPAHHTLSAGKVNGRTKLARESAIRAEPCPPIPCTTRSRSKPSYA